MSENLNSAKFLGKLAIAFSFCVSFSSIHQVQAQTFSSGTATQGTWQRPTYSGQVEQGGEIQIHLPDELVGGSPLQPISQTPQPDEEADARAGTMASMVQHADFNQPIEAISEPTPSAGGTLTSNLPNGEQVSKLFGSFSGDDGLGGRLQSTFQKIDFPKVAGSLAIVLGVYFAFVWLTRKLNGGQVGGLPREVVEVLGVAPFGPKKNLQLVRLGSKLLLLLHTLEGTTTIGEISDPDEVEYLTGVCHGRRTSRPHAPRQVRQQMASQPVGVPAQEPSNSRVPEVTLPASELENVVRQLAKSAKASSGTIFEA